MEDKQIKFGIELPESLRKRMKVAAAERDLALKDAYEQACRDWVAAGAVTTDPEDVAQTLLTVYYRGDEHVRTMLQEIVREHRNGEEKKVAHPRRSVG